MAKRKGGGGGANWMDTYGDMVTLLLCFFVLLYSMSTISEDKWKAIVQSFNPLATEITTDPEGKGGPISDPEIGDDNPGLSEVEEEQKKINEMMEELLESLQRYSKQEGLESTVSVSMDGGVIYLKLMDRAMFVPDKATLLAESFPVLDGICSILEQSKYAIEEIVVEGHTAQQYDDRPNEPAGDWNLSSARAATVTTYIDEHTTIHPARLSTSGHGQWHPIEDNKGEAGKAPNRRVELVISAKEIGSELNKKLASFTDQDGGEP